MSRPRVLAVLALVAAFAGAGLTVTWLSLDEGTLPATRVAATIRDPLGEALGHIPRTAPYVAVVDTDSATGPLRATLDLLARLSGADELTRQLDGLLGDAAGLGTGAELAGLAGAPAVLARNGTRADAPVLLAWVVPDAEALRALLGQRVQEGRLQAAGSHRGAAVYSRSGRGGLFAQRNRVLVAASDRTALRAALDRGTRRRRSGRPAAARLTPSAFASRAASGVSARDAVVRVAVTAPGLRRLIADRVRGAGRLPWVTALQGAGIGVRADEDGLHVRARVRTDETMLSETDLPLATGTQAPELSGEDDVRVGFRAPVQPIRFLLDGARAIDAGRRVAIAEVRTLLSRVARVDVEREILSTLTGDATISLPDADPLTVRAQTADEEGVRSALQRLARAGSLVLPGGSPGLGQEPAGIALRDDGEDAYTLSRDGSPVAVVALRGDVLVVSGDPGIDVDAIEDALGQAPDEPGVRGSLLAHATATGLGDLLVDRLGLPRETRRTLESLDGAVLTGRAHLRFLNIGLDLPVDG